MLQKLFGITLILFMAGSLLEVGLRLEVAEALAALRHGRFMVYGLLWCFVLGPSLAIVLTKIIPLAGPYALGLIMLGLAPCSSGLPMMMRKTGGSLAYGSAFMLLANLGTLVLMPLMVPLLAKGFTADPWTIAKPLLHYIALPLSIGMVIRRLAGTVADKIASGVKTVTGIATIAMVAFALLLHGRVMIGSIGTFAIGTQVLYYTLLAFIAYRFSFGLSYEQKVPMTIGVCTRNVGPALAPLLAAPDAPEGAITMCILGALLGNFGSGLASAAVLKRLRNPAGKRATTAVS